jgi:hypothetical protein
MNAIADDGRRRRRRRRERERDEKNITTYDQLL